jgi:ABC-type multidrug transport system ATPase subunit
LSILQENRIIVKLKQKKITILLTTHIFDNILLKNLCFFSNAFQNLQTYLPKNLIEIT